MCLGGGSRRNNYYQEEVIPARPYNGAGGYGGGRHGAVAVTALVTSTWAVVTTDLVSMEGITECITVAIMEDIIMEGITDTMVEVHLALVVTTEATTGVTMGCITEGIMEGITEFTMAAIITRVKSSTLDS
ncbi:hypothetical protein NQ176_g6620 [Zarea fungicola]|uniref:Uncharacterized protein n=1 Tax=Zarea fungicola TaxID=93591 RepID=A0ACC1N4Q7_9HYPO|nr:hypothetical protein NQ176_g6620 [Lecanicillium fungicola]